MRPSLFYALALLLAVLLSGCFLSRYSDAKAIKEFAKLGILLRTRDYAIAGHQLHAAMVGSDTLPTILFIHGSPGSWDAYKAYLLNTSLRARFRLISIDRPGYGATDGGQAVHLSEACAIISSFIDSVANGRKLYLVGHSLGGSIVPMLAADNGDKVAAIVVLAGAVDPSDEKPERWRAAFTHAPLKYLLPTMLRASIAELWYFKQEVYEIKPKLPLITSRVYIVHAINDALVNVKNVAFMKTYMTHATVTDTIFPSGNHFLPWNHQPYITKLLLQLE